MQTESEVKIMDNVKIGTVELTETEAEKLYSEGKYIVTYSKVYQLFYSKAMRGVYGQLIYLKPTRYGVGLVQRGRYIAATAKEVNKILGFPLLNEN